jgi:4-hydroxybenzoate polyprenyltransferase
MADVPDLATPDAERAPSSSIERLPAALRPYARLARFDRPIGSWLLFWPCGWGLAAAALWLVHPDPLTILALVLAAAHFAWQVATLSDHDPAQALRLFRANRTAGLLIFAACAVAGT